MEEALEAINPDELTPKEALDAIYRLKETSSLKEIGKEMVFKLMDGTVEVTKNRNSCVAYLDAEKVLMPLIIRNAKPGDRFQPFGMDGLLHRGSSW